MPGSASLRKYGTVAAAPRTPSRRSTGRRAARLPGGDYEVHRPTWESAKVDFDGRRGSSGSRSEKVPIVPVVAIGGQETALFLSRGERLAQLLGLDRCSG
jgi:hypothetical protein